MRNKLTMPLTILGFLSGAAALVITWLRSDDVRIEKPSWMKEPPHAAHEAPKGEPGHFDRVEAPPSDGKAGGASAAKEMAANGRLASALTESKQAITFNARTLIDAGIAKEVADGMVGVMDVIAPTYDDLVSQNAQTVHRYVHEFLIAIWPDLGDLVRRGEVKLGIEAFPPSNWSQPKVAMATNFNKSDKVLSYSMNLERWQVTLEFTENSNPNHEIFAKIVSASLSNQK